MRGHLVSRVQHLPTASVTFASSLSRLHTLCLPISTAGITPGRVTDLIASRESLVAVRGLDLIRRQTLAATVHLGHSPDDEDNGKDAEDHDVEHG